MTIETVAYCDSEKSDVKSALFFILNFFCINIIVAKSKIERIKREKKIARNKEKTFWP